MTTDERHEGFGQMLRKGATTSVPPTLHADIMQKVRAVGDRRIHRRVVLTFLLRFVAVCFLLALLVNIFMLQLPNIDLAAVTAQLPEKLYTAGLWLSDHVYYLIALIIAGILLRVLRFKTD